MSQLLDTVPALLEGMLPLLTTPAEAAPLRACGAVLYGGAPLGAAALGALRALGVAPVSQYGQTELGGMALLGSPCAPRGWLEGAVRPA